MQNPKQKRTLKQLEAKERREKKDHSRAYLSPEFKAKVLTWEAYDTMSPLEKYEYRQLFVEIPQHRCGYCFESHIFGGYCSEEGESFVSQARLNNPPTRSQRRCKVNPNH